MTPTGNYVYVVDANAVQAWQEQTYRGQRDGYPRPARYFTGQVLALNPVVSPYDHLVVFDGDTGHALPKELVTPMPTIRLRLPTVEQWKLYAPDGQLVGADISADIAVQASQWGSYSLFVIGATGVDWYIITVRREGTLAVLAGTPLDKAGQVWMVGPMRQSTHEGTNG